MRQGDPPARPIDQIVDQIMGLPERTKFQILAPVVRGKKGEHQKVFEDARRGGYARVRVDGNLYDLSEEIQLDKNKKHNIEVVVDRLVIRSRIIARRLTDSVETASNLAGGLVIVDDVGRATRSMLFSQNYACEDCGISMAELIAAHVLVQQPLRRLPRRARAWACSSGVDPDAHHPRPQPRPF